MLNEKEMKLDLYGHIVTLTHLIDRNKELYKDTNDAYFGGKAEAYIAGRYLIERIIRNYFEDVSLDTKESEEDKQ